MEKYVFRKYEMNYGKLFEKEKSTLLTFLENVEIEHVGSTAVLGLGGKGIIDIMIGVEEKKRQEVKELLQKNGYDFKEAGGDEKRLFFKKRSNSSGWTHVHVVELLGDKWEKTLFFRDYLRKNPDEAKKYSQIKKEAVLVANGDGKKYRDHKEKYIEEIVKKVKEKAK